MKIITVFAGLCFLMTAHAVAQETDKLITNYTEVFSTGYEGSQMALHIRPEGRYTEIKGTPYLFEPWCEGRILLKDDTIGGKFKMRYNVYGNEMQFINNLDTLAIANPLKVDAVWLNNRRFEYLSFTHNNNANMAWFEVIGEGKTRLLVRYSSRLESGMDPVTPYHCQNSYDRFVSGKYYYYQTPEMESPQELPASRGSFLSIREFNKPDLREFIHARKINFHNEQDLNVLFTWINKSSNKI
jgi:hypothetical protein